MSRVSTIYSSDRLPSRSSRVTRSRLLRACATSPRKTPHSSSRAVYLDGLPISPDEINKLADLESREVLLAKLAGAMKASLQARPYPVRSAAGSGSSHRRRLARQGRGRGSGVCATEATSPLDEAPATHPSRHQEAAPEAVAESWPKSRAELPPTVHQG